MTTSSTRLQLETECVRLLAQKDEQVKMLPVPLVTTTGGSTTTARSTVLGRGSGHANRFDGRHVKIAESVGGGPALGEIAAVDNSGFDNIDQLTVSPALSAAVATGTDLLIYPMGYAPETVTQEINRVLRTTEHDQIWYPSLVPDHYLESADTANWDEVGTTTRSFVTSITDIPLLSGERALKVIANAIVEGVKSEAFSVDEGEGLTLSVLLAVESFTVAGVRAGIIDVTNTADVLGTSVVTNSLWTWYLEHITIPSNCRQARLQVILGTGGTAATFYLGAPVIIQSNYGRMYALPAWLQRKEQILDVVRITPGQSANDSGEYVGASQYESLACDYDFFRSERDANPHHIRFQNRWGYPVGLLCQRKFDELPADTSTSTIDKDYVANRVVANLLKQRDDSDWKDFDRTARSLAVTLGYGRREVRLKPTADVYV